MKTCKQLASSRAAIRATSSFWMNLTSKTGPRPSEAGSDSRTADSSLRLSRDLKKKSGNLSREAFNEAGLPDKGAPRKDLTREVLIRNVLMRKAITRKGLVSKVLIRKVLMRKAITRKVLSRKVLMR